MTWIARRRFEAQYADGERVTIEARERLADEHQLARSYPEMFDHRNDERPVTRPAQNGRARVRSASGGGAPRRRLTAEQQGRIRRARLDELAARERERPKPPDAETLFWKGVARLLGFDRLQRQAEDDERFLGRFDAAKASDVRAGVEGLTEWLAR